MSNVKVFDISTTSPSTHLSNNFTLGELACPCGCHSVKVDLDLVAQEQQCREYWGRPVYAGPWYRCPTYNARNGGDPRSWHMFGRAVDKDVGSGNTQIPPLYVALYDELILGLGGIGLYEYADGRSCVHNDNGLDGDFWISREPGKKTYVKTFVTNTRKQAICTDRQIVRLIQELLNRCGYDLLVDGKFGKGTDAAVRDFQNKQRLDVDGIVGKVTLTRLFVTSKNW